MTPFWRAPDDESREQLCVGVLSLTGRTIDADTREKALLALKHMHAARLVGHDSEGEQALGEQADGEFGASLGARRDGLRDGASTCRQRGVLRAALLDVVASCEELHDESGCTDLLPLAHSMLQQLADGRASPRVQASDTVFHWEV
jgi:hypothetical protein